MDSEYYKLLDRALSQLPERREEEFRWKIPTPKVFIEGRTSVLENFGAIVDYLNRDKNHFMKFLLHELGTAGKIEGNRAIFQGKFSEESIAQQIERYVTEYVICSECGKPDTRLVRVERILTLKCDACGAHRPVAKRRVKKVEQHSVVEEGKTYDMKIEAVGNKGDGIARMDKYTIFIPNAKKDEIIRAKIKKISGTLAFAEREE
ncbi:MAG: translation initiation factor IF-2 subunit beta [Candidatus Syntropharchaeia archaeon]